jgi:L-2-hydroxyglutarate oxidase
VTLIYDFAIVGGGIVGLSTAVALKKRDPHAAILLLEKESDWARHQTGRNSGVIHSGIYYKPGSFKATFCRAGNRSMVAFCREHEIAHELCGKVIVATQPQELPLLESLHRRGLENELRVERITAGQLREIEPHVSGLAALRVLDAGIVDYKAVCRAMVAILQGAGCELRLNTRLLMIDRKPDRIELVTPQASFVARRFINCAGLHSDRVARLGRAPQTARANADSDLRIVPFRGEYFELTPERRSLVRHLVYPVPDPAFPFLGVHFTRLIDGRVEAGPNAVLALAREGYRKTDVDLRDLCEVLAFPGFRKLAGRHWREALREQWRSISKRAFLRSLQRLIPEIAAQDLAAPSAGIRAQALTGDGKLVDDFRIIDDGLCLHVCNAPSPAATASLEIGNYISSRLLP